MCGIAGTVGLSYSAHITQTMLETMKRRGPDAQGIWSGNECCLLHSRLSIIDPVGGSQPMSLSWQGDTYTIVYNGELYNTQEIRDLLIKLGHKFFGHSDTEVILHAYAQWFENCVEKFNGIFAFGVWEHKRRKLFLARDRMGVKPLFYRKEAGTLVFASEIKTILAHPDVKPRLDAQGAMEILLIGPGRTPGNGIFTGIQELEPGCYGYFAAGKWNWKRYWKLRDREHTETFEETAQYVKYLVSDAIRRQMVSDVPLGTFLSGGLDSSLISSVCAKERAEAGETLLTFSVDYENNDRYFVPGKFQPNSDGEYIQIMQQYLQSNHHWTVLKPEDLVDALEDSTIARDLPGMADVDFSLLLFCRQIRGHVKVALSGECADEIFGGYPWYRDPEVRSLDGFPWAQNTKERIAFLSPELLIKIKPEEYVADKYAQTIASCDILPGTSALERRMKEMVNLNQRWFMQTLLDRKDRMSMYSGLEVRVPFCDYRIAEYMYGVPWEFKDYQGREKGLLRYAMSDFLPQEVLYRKKSPYPKTYDPRYFELVSAKLRDVLSKADSPILQLVNRQALINLLNAEFTWPWYGQLMKVPQTIAYMLQINFWLEHYNIDIL
ncbi:MAG: asparagine synthase (glutamine-hydrolyzing) [Oscillospiraceae bacterium]|nr:asparagine synthase (glutamine-hydrolyzing) [Oscillospiraceae bacterium]